MKIRAIVAAAIIAAGTSTDAAQARGLGLGLGVGIVLGAAISASQATHAPEAHPKHMAGPKGYRTASQRKQKTSAVAQAKPHKRANQEEADTADTKTSSEKVAKAEPVVDTQPNATAEVKPATCRKYSAAVGDLIEAPCE